MQTIVTDLCNVLSVCHVPQLGFTVQKRLFILNTLGDPMNIVLHGGSDPPQSGEGREILAIVDPDRISGTAEDRKLKFCIHIEGWGP